MQTPNSSKPGKTQEEGKTIYNACKLKVVFSQEAN
jgi:hypothetical protein